MNCEWYICDNYVPHHPIYMPLHSIQAFSFIVVMCDEWWVMRIGLWNIICNKWEERMITQKSLILYNSDFKCVNRKQVKRTNLTQFTRDSLQYFVLFFLQNIERETDREEIHLKLELLEWMSEIIVVCRLPWQRHVLSFYQNEARQR